MYKNQKGFTLIELLVVIAIIAVLTTLAIITTQGVRSRARDASRVSNAEQVVGALEMFYADSSSYPAVITSGEPLASDSKTYMDEVPVNPSPQADGECPNSDFRYQAAPKGYQLTFCLGSDSGRLKKGVNVCSNGNCLPCDKLRVKDLDGNTYKAVEIGGQCWMAENLRTKLKADGTCINGGGTPPCADAAVGDINKDRYCYNGLESNCTTYGALYTQAGAGQAYDLSNAEQGPRGICPLGWHIPTEKEWIKLSVFLWDNEGQGGYDKINDFGFPPAGTALKVGGSSGFEGLLVGIRNAAGSFNELNVQTYYWGNYKGFASCGQLNGCYGYGLGAWSLKIDETGIGRWFVGFNQEGDPISESEILDAISLRCVKDF